MTINTLYTVQEVARLLHVSDDTVRRQIREGDLQAIRIGTTPSGRPRYRIAADVVEEKLGQGGSGPQAALERFRTLFAELNEEAREELLEKALQWARERTTDSAEAREPALTPQDIKKNLSPKAKALLAAHSRK